MPSSSIATTPVQEPWVGAKQRTGTSPVERKAFGKVQHELAAMPASLVVQIALWPTKLSDLARELEISSSMIYNCLAGTKPYEPVRDQLAERLGVSRQAIDHLIEARTPPPPSLVPPDPFPSVPEPVPSVREAAATPAPRSNAAGQPSRRLPRHRKDSEQWAAQIRLDL